MTAVENIFVAFSPRLSQEDTISVYLETRNTKISMPVTQNTIKMNLKQVAFLHFVSVNDIQREANFLRHIKSLLNFYLWQYGRYI